MQHLRFINNPLTQHVLGTIMPVFRSARMYIAAYGFQHLILLAGALGSWEVGSVHCVEDVTSLVTSSTQCTLPASRLLKAAAATSSAGNHMQQYMVLHS